MSDALCDAEPCAHAKASVDHVKRCGISERVAADIAAVDGFPSLHSRFYSVKGGSVRASRTEDGGTHGETGQSVRSWCGVMDVLRCKKALDVLIYAVTAVFTGIFYMVAEFAVYFYRQPVPAA